MTLLDLILLNIHIVSFIRVIREIITHCRPGMCDPFERPCKDMGKLDIPYYLSRKAEYPHEHYIQLVVVVHSAECMGKTRILLQGPDHREDAHFRYTFHTSTVQVAPTVEDIIQPWIDQGYTVIRCDHFSARH